MTAHLNPEETCKACGDRYADHCATYLRIIRQIQERLDRANDRNTRLVTLLEERDQQVTDLAAALTEIERLMRRPQSAVMTALARHRQETAA